MSYRGPSGQAPPATDLPGWALRYVEDFDTDYPQGQVPFGDGRFLTYRPTPDRRRSPGIVACRDSCLDVTVQTIDGVPTGAVVGIDPTGAGSWKAAAQTYGRFALRWRTDPVPGYGFVHMLWPASDVRTEGELDFPEQSLTGNIGGFVHRMARPRENAAWLTLPAPVPAAGAWHTTVIEWRPGRVDYYLDGQHALTSTESPSTPLRPTIQIGTAGSQPPPVDAAGHVLIDWIAAWTPNN